MFVLLPVSLASAHASFVDSNLVDGSMLAKSPPVVELRFSEPVLATVSTVSLLRLGTDSDDESLALSAAGGQTTLLVEVPKLPCGEDILRYMAVDPADLHRRSGRSRSVSELRPRPRNRVSRWTVRGRRSRCE